jgi:hypothetical protein
MAEGDSPSEFHADLAGHPQVPVIILDDWLAASDDAVLRGGPRSFAAHRPPIYLALHGERQRREGIALPSGCRYRVTSLEQGVGPEVGRVAREAL